MPCPDSHRHTSEPEQSRREEDFYYTEVLLDMDQTAPPTGPPAVPPAALPASPSAPWAPCASPPRPTQRATAGPGPRTPEPAAPGAPQPSPLSQSAPSCFWQVRSEHSYQVRRIQKRTLKCTQVCLSYVQYVLRGQKHSTRMDSFTGLIKGIFTL